MGSATEADDFLVDDTGLVLQNNYPDINAGYYGAASDTGALDNPDDGPDRQRPSNCGTPSNCSGPIADGRSTQLDWAAKPPTRNSLLRFRASKRRTS